MVKVINHARTEETLLFRSRVSRDIKVFYLPSIVMFDNIIVEDFFTIAKRLIFFKEYIL